MSDEWSDGYSDEDDDEKSQNSFTESKPSTGRSSFTESKPSTGRTVSQKNNPRGSASSSNRSSGSASQRSSDRNHNNGNILMNGIMGLWHKTGKLFVNDRGGYMQMIERRSEPIKTDMQSANGPVVLGMIRNEHIARLDIKEHVEIGSANDDTFMKTSSQALLKVWRDVSKDFVKLSPIKSGQHDLNELEANVGVRVVGNEVVVLVLEKRIDKLVPKEVGGTKFFRQVREVNMCMYHFLLNPKMSFTKWIVDVFQKFHTWSQQMVPLISQNPELRKALKMETGNTSVSYPTPQSMPASLQTRCALCGRKIRPSF